LVLLIADTIPEQANQMKVSISYEVKAKTVLTGVIEIQKEDRKYIFYPNAEGVLSRIEIVANATDPKRFFSEMVKTPNEPIKHTVRVNSDGVLIDSVEDDFQNLESLLALECNLKSIDWQTRSYKVICETEEEQKNASIYGIDIGRSFPDEPVAVDAALLSAVLNAKDRLQALRVLLGFYREGKNDYLELRYINAFYNHYFILEGMYGKGKTKNDAVAREFKNSKEFNEFVEIIINEMILTYPPHTMRINEMLNGKPLTSETLIDLIVKTRGELHHYNAKRPRVTPFNHNDYQTITAVVQNLALRAILARIVETNQTHESVIV
jgi:hypothetical protein